MQIFAGILAAILLLFMILILIPVRIQAIYEKAGESKAEVTVKYGFITYKIYPSDKKKDKTAGKEEAEDKKEPFSFEEKKRELQKYIRIFESVKGDIIKLLKYLTRRAMVFEKIEVKSEFGFEDAMSTGIFTGIYNGFVYSVLGVIHHNSALREMDVSLTPVFDKKCFNNRFCCILHIKTVHIMIMSFNVLKIYRKIKKEGRK